MNDAPSSQTLFHIGYGGEGSSRVVLTVICRRINHDAVSVLHIDGAGVNARSDGCFHFKPRVRSFRALLCACCPSSSVCHTPA